MKILVQLSLAASVICLTFESLAMPLGIRTATWHIATSLQDSDMVIPTIIGDEGAVVTGDAENGFVVKPSAGKKDVAVTIPDGVEAGKVTVEVGTDVQTVSANGANVKVVKGGHDITEHLDIPSPIDGVVAVGSATVKESVLKETILRRRAQDGP